MNSHFSRRGTLTDRSGTITTGGTAQTAVNQNGNRSFLLIQNVSDIVLWVNFGTVAVASQPSFSIAVGGWLCFDGSYVPTDYVSIIGATTGKGFTIKEGIA